MSVKSGTREVIWVGAGVLGLLALFFTVLVFRAERDPVAQIAFKDQRIALVNAMRLALAANSEAQNSAVMATGGQDLKSFADQARAATAALAREQSELEKLLQQSGDVHEVELMVRVTQTLSDFQRIDKQLLELATQNSNRKAYRLAFGPAMKLLQEMDDTLSRVAIKDAELSPENKLQVLKLASDARIGALRMQVLLLPHIAEESDSKMDQFEQQLAGEDQKLRENFASLSALVPESEKPTIAVAISKFGEFDTLKAQIIKLSRANTDLKAVALALNEKRKAMLACQDALVALERAIQAEPVTTTIPSGRSPSTP